jgi:hypothetical protein
LGDCRFCRMSNQQNDKLMKCLVYKMPIQKMTS